MGIIITNDEGRKKPNPGSDEAIAEGCTCPVLDNGHGRGHLGDGEKFGWWRSHDCPLHGLGTDEVFSDPDQVAISEVIVREATLKEQLDALVDHAEKKWGGNRG